MVARRQVTEWTRRSLPVVLVAFLWVGLWMMWPEAQPYRWRPGKKPFTVRLVPITEAVKLVEDPTVFAFNSEASYQRQDSDFPDLLQMPGIPEGRREFLAMSGQTLKARAKGSVSKYSIWHKSGGGFDDAWSGAKAFEKTSPTNQLVVGLSENLRLSGYAPADISGPDLDARPSGWEVQVLLDIDKTGAPAHVLIEKGSGNKDIDKMICRKVLQGRSVKNAEVRGGRVTVSYGFE